MKKAVLLIAISIVMVSSMTGQSVRINPDQNQFFCGPAAVGNRVFINKYSSNNNYDFPGYMQMNVYNCTGRMFQSGADSPKVYPKKNRRM